MDQVNAKVLRAKWASIRSRHAIAAAHDDLECHHRWLDRHRVAWSEEIKLYESRLKSKLRSDALKRLALGLLLIGPITCLALLRLIAWLLPCVRDLLFGTVSWLHTLARLTRKHVASYLARSRRATKNRSKQHHYGRIVGLDGPLCTGQPASSTLVTKSEAGLLKVRLVVGSFGAVLVGFIAIAPTFDTNKEPAETAPNILEHSGLAMPPHRAALDQSKHVDRLVPDPIQGFGVLASAPNAQRVSLAVATIAEIISLTRPLTDTLERPEGAIEASEVTLPVRKPEANIRVRAKRGITRKKHQLTLREQLPWLR